MSKLFNDAFWPTLFTVVGLIAWEVIVRAMGIRSIILPPPSEVFATMFARYDLLWAHLWPTLYLTVLGFLLAVVGGILVAIVITYSDILRRGFYPVIVVSQVIPKIAIAPLLVVWFGTGTMSCLLLAFLISFFPMTINAAMGFQSVDEDIQRMARTFMGTRWQIFWKVRMPNAMPYIFAGMKISITLAIIGVIVAEFVASQEGIGYLIKLAGGLLDTPLMLAAITVLSIAGLALYWLIAVAEGRAVYWQPPAEAIGGGGRDTLFSSSITAGRRDQAMTMHRRSFLTLTGGAAAAGALGFPSPAIVKAATPVKLTLPWLPVGTYTFVFAAKGKGFWEKRVRAGRSGAIRLRTDRSRRDDELRRARSRPLCDRGGLAEVANRHFRAQGLRDH
jgi:NitT/TauT family transport system permease protein